MSEVVGGSGPEDRAAGPHHPPGAVRTAVVMMYVVAGLALLQGALSLVAAPLNSTHLVVALLSIAFAVAYVVLARQAGRGDRMARSVTVALSGLSLLADLWQLRTSPVAGIVGVGLNGSIILLLTASRDGRRFFARPAGPDPA